MFGDFQEAVERQVRISDGGESADKVMSLAQAVEKFVEPGMHIHIGHSYARPCAAVNEIVRQFWGKDPNFVMSSLGFTGPLVLLFLGGMVRKSIATFHGDSYPMPGPNPVYQKAYREGSVEFQDWTILSFCQRLMAGATGLPFIPTRSIVGSSLEEENAEDLFIQELPGGERVAMIRALRPDLALFHGWASDPAGNVICAPPYAEGGVAARAAREGALVTVERVVDHEFIRRYSHFVKIPSYLVKAVAVAPYGTHPGGLANQGLETEFNGYEVDREFLIELRGKCRDEEDLREWANYWVLECEDQEEYLNRLGHERIWNLTGKASKGSWKAELKDALPDMNPTETYNPTEMMIVVGSREIKRKVEENGYRTILAGVGASNLAAWDAQYRLMESGHDVSLMAEVGFYGYSPQPADPYIFNLRNVPNCRMLTDIYDVLGSLVNAESNRCIGALGAGQVDKFGNVNSTKIPEMDLLLVGSGGANDVAVGAREVVVLIDHSPERLVDKVPYVTSPGEKIRMVITSRCILEKEGNSEELVLTGYFPDYEGRGWEEIMNDIKLKCG